MLKAVIFDMDGVIIDSEMDYLKMDLAFVQRKNPQAKLADLLGMVGASRQDAWEYVARAVHNGQTWKELHDEYRQENQAAIPNIDYRQIYRSEVTGILDFIKSKGLAIALASSTHLELILHVLEVNQIRDYFEVVVTGAQFKRSKPDPEIYHYTARQLAAAESECLVIEDSTFGITAASRAGMTIAALIDLRFHFDRSLADYQMERLTEIPGIVESLL